MGTLDDSERVNDLYACYGQLAECKGDEVGQKEQIFKKIIGAVNGCDKERRLVSQFIPVFFKYFPRLTEMALDAQLDLCEDPDCTVRRQAIKDLPILCRDCPRLTRRIVLILTQLLASKDPLELRVIHTALITIFKTDPKVSVMGLCHQIRNDKQLREKCLRFLSYKICNIVDTLKPEAVEVIISEANTLLTIAALEELPLVFKMMFSAYKSSNLGYTAIINSITQQLNICLPFTPDTQSLDRMVMLLKHGLFLFVENYPCGHPNDLIEFICIEILPHIEKIPKYELGKGHTLEILQILAELTNYIESFSNCETVYSNVMDFTLKCLPTEEVEAASTYMKSKIHFSYMECMLYTLHKFTRFNHTLFLNNERFIEFKSRISILNKVMRRKYNSLKQFANAVSSNCIPSIYKNHARGMKRKTSETVKELSENNYFFPFAMSSDPRWLLKWKDVNADDRNSLDDKSTSMQIKKELTKMDLNDVMFAAVATYANIFKLFKDFLITPCKCESVITLSFVSDEKYDKEADVYETDYIKRNQQYHDRPSNSGLRMQRALYIPPNKRYSSTFRRPQ